MARPLESLPGGAETAYPLVDVQVLPFLHRLPTAPGIPGGQWQKWRATGVLLLLRALSSWPLENQAGRGQGRCSSWAVPSPLPSAVCFLEPGEQRQKYGDDCPVHLTVGPW